MPAPKRTHDTSASGPIKIGRPTAAPPTDEHGTQTTPPPLNLWPFEGEKPIPLAGAAALLPALRPGNATTANYTTLYRWATKGLKARDRKQVVLETIRVGRRMLTTREAIDRFQAEFNGDGAAGGGAEAVESPRTGASGSQ